MTTGPSNTRVFQILATGAPQRRESGPGIIITNKRVTEDRERLGKKKGGGEEGGECLRPACGTKQRFTEKEGEEARSEMQI